jgi:glycosyltransferase involved in cell wall biosynthesis
MNLSDLSIIITSYNRKGIISNSIDSALMNCPNAEVIIVDDASKDNTIQYLELKYFDDIKNKKIKIFSLNKNIGVTGAKNYGFLASTRRFVGFLDSDDTLIRDSGLKMIKEFQLNQGALVYFFRCKDHNGEIVGDEFVKSTKIDLKYFINHTTKGEVFTVVDKSLYNSSPYFTLFRGYEGIGIATILENGFGVISKEFVRIYDSSGEDRLSIGLGFNSRKKLLLLGHQLMYKKYRHLLPWNKKIIFLIKILYHKLL